MAILLKQAILLRPGEDALLHALAAAWLRTEIHSAVAFKDFLDRLMAAEGGKEQVNVAQMSEVLSKAVPMIAEALRTNPRGTLEFLMTYRPSNAERETRNAEQKP